jgi:membrane carboxypeptidase/penicillin-binding protein PbpC
MNHSAAFFRHRLFRHKKVFISVLFLLILMISGLWAIGYDIENRYRAQLPNIVYDRNQVPLTISENNRGHYVQPLKTLPEDFRALLIKKEDRYFYYHFGINPFSTLRAIYMYTVTNSSGGASTITQQLSKNLLGTELDRSFSNKLREAFYSLSLELLYSKDEIVLMYGNTVYLGNQVQGFETASYAYFNKPLSELSHSEQLSLLATLSYPNARNPWEAVNEEYAQNLHKRISPDQVFVVPEKTTQYSFTRNSFFELSSAGVTCITTCTTTTDEKLTESIREILKRYLSLNAERGARNGAVVVIDPKTSEVLTLVGSKDPGDATSGNQINMTLEPRPIGSTVKPLIYLKGFMDGLRPYTIVDDREYKYSIATGFPLYPKNYDGKYRGEVTLHAALSNSLNVPSVKVLEYIGLPNFYTFLSNSLAFQPLQNYDSYQYGIALGGLEMDLLTLTHYFTLFPRGGTLEPLHILKNSQDNFSLPPQSNFTRTVKVADQKYTELVHAIISDRTTGVDQFGLESTLNIEATDYGVKTGTSRDFHDSWVVGYTGDFVVGVWIGNTENEPLKQVSGQMGAGVIWHEVMNLLLASTYNKNTLITRENLAQFSIDNSLEWGLPDDDVQQNRELLRKDTIIMSPHADDSFEFFTGMTIPLRATKEVEWFLNGNSLGRHTETEFSPTAAGTYELMAVETQSSRREIISVQIISPE